MPARQGTLLDLVAEPGPGILGPHVERVVLGEGAWVDLRRDWMGGAAELFDRLLDEVPWKAESRTMYDRVIDVPRRVCFYGEGAALPVASLDYARRVLDDHYRAELGEPFRTVGLCLYRNGRDSVAWHGDTIGRGAAEDTMVAILSLGGRRRFLIRKRGGGPSRRYDLGEGDLLVMGGSCQRTFEHAVPKTTRTVAPRISVQFRTRDVR
jgi:alkylated DNA repair dioxygenase AlkB